MHRCLLVAEIFSHITYFSTADTRGGLGGKTEAYRLALTCKALSETALDAVWREIHSLIDLVYLLPADLWRGPADRRSKSFMTRETVESDWTRFLVHARRVRKLTFPHDDHLSRRPPWNAEIVDGSAVLRRLQQKCPEPYMLPTLITLVWRVELDNIHIFFCPTLRNLELHTSTAYSGLAELLEAKAPLMTSLNLNSRWSEAGNPPDDVLGAVSQAVTLMDRLVQFHCGFRVHSRTIAHLSCLPRLQQLSVPFDSVDDPALLSTPSSNFFPGLMKLIIRPSQPTLLCSLLTAISSTCLDSLWWEINDTDPNNILDIVTILANHGSRDELESVWITAPWELLVGALPTDSLTMHTLTPLLSLTNLTDLHLSISWLDLSNDDLEQIGLQLPGLERVNLSSCGLLIPSRITLRGILPLFHHCTLESLGIIVDAGDDIPDSEFALPPDARTRSHDTRDSCAL
ncbi:hypothetical protein B0H19DRAFT_1059567 [Mycena capillaripes]|nr:hypothetical protein B0H19DRAFT_1059567 [Mycena capillaripes]